MDPEDLKGEGGMMMWMTDWFLQMMTEGQQDRNIQTVAVQTLLIGNIFIWGLSKTIFTLLSNKIADSVIM